MGVLKAGQGSPTVRWGSQSKEGIHISKQGSTWPGEGPMARWGSHSQVWIPWPGVDPMARYGSTSVGEGSHERMSFPAAGGESS